MKTIAGKFFAFLTFAVFAALGCTQPDEAQHLPGMSPPRLTQEEMIQAYLDHWRKKLVANPYPHVMLTCEGMVRDFESVMSGQLRPDEFSGLWALIECGMECPTDLGAPEAPSVMKDKCMRDDLLQKGGTEVWIPVLREGFKNGKAPENTPSQPIDPTLPPQPGDQAAPIDVEFEPSDADENSNTKVPDSEGQPPVFENELLPSNPEDQDE